ncbi:MAG: hypothetical protein FJY85_08880 [Deltaproteobacteria bacterium]|nr:hypothetical protein [Deltaproteobacteria bacterium]
MIHYDNTTLYIADQDGLMFGELVNPDEIRLIYLETTRHGQVASRGTLKRQKVRWGNS